MCRGSTLLLASLAAVLVKVVALKIDTVVAVPELLREEKMLALLLETQ